MQRSIQTYDPFADAAERWPDWTIGYRHLAGITAVYSASRRTFLLDADHWRGREPEGVAEAVAHLDLGHCTTAGGLTQLQQERGRWLAQVRMDREGDRDLV